MSDNKKITISKSEKKALFCKNMDNGCCSGNENGLIWINSKEDRNEVLESMIFNYLKDVFLTKDNYANIFHYASRADGNNFVGQFFDESHHSWESAKRVDIRKHINICEKDFSEFTERKLIGLLKTCYLWQFATIPIQLNNGQEKEISITEFIQKINEAQNNKYQDYTNIAEKIFNGAKNKNNEKTHYENIQLEENETNKIDYYNFFYVCRQS